ncbi:PspC domain-containing protein [Actinoplanes sp. NPDC024001]|uniref:PspC domain-containing protein n=1 Tax=Actinoplanes sp. NPDC024001 TaxID=3154598 RepID=UPI0034119644
MTIPSITGPEPPVGPSPSAAPDRQLRRSHTDRVLGGVCGGLGRYFGVDPVLLRIAAVALALATGVAALAYIIAWIAIPEDSGELSSGVSPSSSGTLSWYVGLVLITLGGVLLLRLAMPWFDVSLAWPLLIIVTGIIVLISATRRRS